MNGAERKNEKVFCVGVNKTGTTSLETALRDLGYLVAPQAQAESLLPAYLARDFSPIIDYAKQYEAFQDIPFSLPFLYIVLDQVFPGSKFILSVRESADQWYESLVNFHGDLLADGNVPTVQLLKDCTYRYKGFMFDAQCGVVPGTDADPYDKELNIEFYNTHNDSVVNYFRGRPNLLRINVANKDAYLRMCDFLGRTPVASEFPWIRPSPAL